VGAILFIVDSGVPWETSN